MKGRSLSRARVGRARGRTTCTLFCTARDRAKQRAWRRSENEDAKPQPHRSFMVEDVLESDLKERTTSVPVKGDSMEPEFNKGDIIIVSPTA